MTKNITRLIKAFAKEGLDVRRDDQVWQVRLNNDPNLGFAEILLPDDFALEAKAVHQLAILAAVPGVTRCCATPDFHPGDGVAIGSVAESRNVVVPAAVGGDINCGMRLHVADIGLDAFRAKRDVLVGLLKGDFFFGTRDVTQSASVQRWMFEYGIRGWMEAQAAEDWQHGLCRRSDHEQLVHELARVLHADSFSGSTLHVPPGLVPDTGLVRDDGLGTIGGGNHFVEFQVVDEVVDRRLAYDLGLQEGRVGCMVHSGSRLVGKYIGQNMNDKAKKAWQATGRKFPPNDMFPLAKGDPLYDTYWGAQGAAANYGFVNRLYLAEIVRLRFREVFGDVEMPLVADVPHNVAIQDGERILTRKGACPAGAGVVSLIPGSMGSASYVCVGLGNERFLQSASHGAGRSRTRMDMRHADDLGLDGVDCVTLREERRVEEAPAAYKDIGPVVEAQVRAGILRVVARMKPILTFKA